MRRTLPASVVGIALTACLAACTVSREPAARSLSLAEFSQDEPLVNVVESSGREDDGEPARPSGTAAGATDEVALGAGDVRVLDPDAVDAQEPQGERAVLVESLIGQINGRAIYADVFFQPIEDQLMAASEQARSERQFRDMANRIIMPHLEQEVLDELFLAEAEASLSADERKGLLAWMRQVREQVIAERGGNRSSAEAKLREELGREIDVEGYVGEERDRQLVLRLISEKIWSRVIVSWRDIEREYQRRYDEFNPPSHAQLKRIRLSKRRHADLIETTRQALDAGEPFAAVAARAGMADGGEWQEFEVDSRGLAAVELSEAFINAISTLAVGETTEGFEVGSSVWWIHYASLESPEGTSLYDPDLQRRLRAQIRSRRFAEEQSRFIASLLEDGIYEQLQGMAQRLELIAMARYSPS
ncbi:MAG: hypothetical protein ACYTGR_08240 [Planctomycetota bacterium]|jgi:hypothetical protein